MQSHSPSRSATKVVVATTVMLSFISFWRAAAIVLSDLASSAYYVGGIAETAVGKSAPWFILAIMLFSYAVRSIYIESCSMFVRGGVYRVVHEALGGTLAKFSVSALMFDYVLTGPISGVSAGLYLAGLINEIGDYFSQPAIHVAPASFACVFAILTTLYFWHKNIIGIHESSTKALRIMQITTVMVVILIVWCISTILIKGFSPVPLPKMSNLHFGNEALGWLKHSSLPSIPLVALLVGLGHSLLAMSGEESLAQVNREIEHPKLRNLERAGFVIFIYSMLFTSLVSFFSVMIIPDADRAKYLDNLIGGLAMFLVGPEGLRLAFHAFVVLVGTLILAGAVNTAIIGSNGVLNRVAEDGVLPKWFRRPESRYGTSYRIINLIVILQILTILISRGDVYMLGEAYAFGVVWSFAMKGLAVLILRFKQPEAREWRVPLNIKLGEIELPVGLAIITSILFVLAVVNLLTKTTATIAGSSFTVAFFVLFYLSERYNKGRRTDGVELEEFRLEMPEELSSEAVAVRPGNIVVGVRNPHGLFHLKRILELEDTNKTDVVALCVRAIGSGEHQLESEQLFTDHERELFSKVVEVGEKSGKPVSLLVVPGINPFDAIIQTTQRLNSSRIIVGGSRALSIEEQSKSIGDAWERLPWPKNALELDIIFPDGELVSFPVGPHAPALSGRDIDLLHQLWLELASTQTCQSIHHRDVITVALKHLEQDLHSHNRHDELMRWITDETGLNISRE